MVLGYLSLAHWLIGEAEPERHHQSATNHRNHAVSLISLHRLSLSCIESVLSDGLFWTALCTSLYPTTELVLSQSAFHSFSSAFL
jgi:hypothetical protein